MDSKDNNTFALNRSFLREILERYHEIETDAFEFAKENASFARAYKVRKPFSRRRIQGHVRKLLAVSFWASLKKEEGRHHQFAVVYAPPPDPKSVSNDYVVFNPRLAFDAEILAKLAPALESTHTLRVWPKLREAGKDELEIWGFARPSVGPPLLVKAIEPGQIILWISDMWKARITERAELVEVGVYADIFSGVQPNYRAQSDSTAEVEKIVKEQSRPDLERIAVAMRAHGHGGILLVIPDANTRWGDSIDMGKFRFSPYEKFKTDLVNRDEAVGQFASGTIANDFHSPFERMVQSIKSIAQFTAVDGATIITPDRVLLGFGAKIKPLKKRSDERYNLLVVNPFYESQPESKNLSELPWGTRHKSAARFVFDQPGTVAIVASADGRLSVFKRDGGRILVLTDAEFLWL